jgi:tRNA 2-selenouridine synthase
VNAPSFGANRVGPDAIASFADIVDVRTPAEFDDDHVPGAVNAPVLSDEERARVGTLHAQSSAFEARKVGAALISRNIAALLDEWRDRPRDFAPLVYCWRGGQRSRSLAHVMNEIGWRAMQLDGGYRAYRRHVVGALAELPARFSYRVICGMTGSGKSRMLAALREEGAQVLDLEAVACHRGSLLGDLPNEPQPSQKRFESRLWHALKGLDVARPVFVESESRHIGRVQVPPVLLDAMRAARCVRVDLPLELRVSLLKDEYAHFMDDPSRLTSPLSALVPLHGKAEIERWTEAAERGDWDGFVQMLLGRHYDPAYGRAIQRNFPNFANAQVVMPAGLDVAAFRTAALSLLQDATEEAR